jgi:hypothetical protein
LSNETKAINMNINTEQWAKVGFMAVMEGSTKKEIVEKAIQLLWDSNHKNK